MTLYLDIETTDWLTDPHIKSLPREGQLAAMRLGCAVTYNSVANEWIDWMSVLDLWPYCRFPDTTIVGWNIIDFDWPVLRANAERVSPELGSYGVDPQFLDLFAEIRRTTGRWYKLEDVCRANLGRGKIGDGQMAAQWLRSSDLNLIRRAVDYCRYDVELVVSLHSRLLSGDRLRLLPRPARGELNELLWTLDGHERLPDESGAVSMK